MPLVIREPKTEAPTTKSLVLRTAAPNPLAVSIDPLPATVDPLQAQAVDPAGDLNFDDFGKEILEAPQLAPVAPADREIGLAIRRETREQRAERQGEEVGQLFGPQAKADFVTAQLGGMNPQLFDQHLGDIASSETKSFSESAGEFIGAIGPAVGDVAKSVLNASLKVGSAMLFAPPEEKLAVAIEGGKASVEAFARNAVGLGELGSNLFGALGDELGTQEEEIKREYIRRLATLRNRALMDKGLLIDPKDVDADLLATAELLVSPENIIPGAGPALRAGRGGKILQAASRLPRTIARESIKKSSRVVNIVAAGVEESIKGTRALKAKAVAGVKGGGKNLGEKAKKVLLPEELRGVKVPGAVKTAGGLLALPGRVPLALGLFTTSVGARGVQAMARKIRTVSGSIADPNRQRRFLDRMHLEHNSKLAGIASRLGGTQAGDILFNAVVDGTTVGTLAAAEAFLAGEDATGAGTAFGSAAGIGGLISGAVGERGAGATTSLLQDGSISSRSQGSFDQAKKQILAKRGPAMVEFDQASKLDAMPDAAKAVLGEAAESGFLPNNVLFLEGKDFNNAAKLSLARDDVSATTHDNAVLSFPEDNVLLLNADSDLSGPASMKVIAEELGQIGATEMLKSQPGLVALEAKRFEDPNGREIPVDRMDAMGTTKINAEMASFMDDYNQAADAAGAPPISTFFEAITQYYGAAAGVSLSSPTSVFSPSTPVWVQKVVHSTRTRMLRSTGQAIQNRPTTARAIDAQANTAMGRHIQQQFKIWQQEATALKAKSNQAYSNQTTNVALDERSALAKGRAARQGIDVPQGKDAASQAAAIVAADPNSNGPVRTFTPKLGGRRPKRREMLDLLSTFTGGKASGRTRIVGLPEPLINKWLERYAPDDQASTLAFLNSMLEAGANKQAQNFFYFTREGQHRGSGDHRNMVPTGRWGFVDRSADTLKALKKGKDIGREITVPEENGILQMEVRDLDAIDYNLRLAELDNIYDGLFADFAEAKAHVLSELDNFQADPTYQVSDLTKVTLMDDLTPTKKVKGVVTLREDRIDLDLKTDKFKEFFTKNKKKGGLERTNKAVDFDRILAAANNINGSTNFGQRGAQRGLNFTAIPEGFDFSVPFQPAE